VVNLVCTILQSLLCSLHARKDFCELYSELKLVSGGCGLGWAWIVVGVLFDCEAS